MSELSTFQVQVGTWGDKTFNHEREKNSKGILYHLAREVDELLESNSPEEAVDCFLLLLHHAHQNGYDLLHEAKKKMSINYKRRWGSPDSNGVIEHERNT